MPQHKRGPWSQGEDQFLLSLVHIHGAHNWVRISQALQTRSPKQCRERFHQNLKPTLNHDPITPEEGLLIEQMVADMGKRWAEIARRLRGRSDNAVKNWWNGGMNRRRRSTTTNAASASGNNAVIRRSGLQLGPPPPPAQHQQQQQPHQIPPQQQMSAPMVQPQHQHQHPHHAFATHQQHPLPSNFPPHLFGMNMTGYHQPMPQPIRVPSNGPVLRPHHAQALVETPLPSPSAYSQMSAEGAPPSLISDSSSVSGRSPHTGASPVELPPLAAARHPAGMAINMAGAPFVADGDFPVHMHATTAGMIGDKRVMQPHEGFIQQHQQQYQQAIPYGAMSQYNPAQRLAAGIQQPYSHAAHAQMTRPPPPPPQHLLPSQPVQLPSIAALPAVNDGSPTQQQSQQFLDAELASSRARETPAPSATTPDGSPRDKMSLSNLTH